MVRDTMTSTPMPASMSRKTLWPRLTQLIDRIRISQYQRHALDAVLRQERAAAHVERARSGAQDYI
jgi:hypothetical protein